MIPFTGVLTSKPMVKDCNKWNTHHNQYLLDIQIDNTNEMSDALAIQCDQVNDEFSISSHTGESGKSRIASDSTKRHQLPGRKQRFIWNRSTCFSSKGSHTLTSRRPRWNSVQSSDQQQQVIDPLCHPTDLCLNTERRAVESTLLECSSVETVMKNVFNLWTFNVFSLQNITRGSALSVLCMHLAEKLDLIAQLSLCRLKLFKFFCLVEESYNSFNSYHNSVHAADVVQAVFSLLHNTQLLRHYTPLEKLTVLFSAAGHDLDHPGVNQAFLVSTSNHLSHIYKNISVLENHHWRMTASCISESHVIAHLTSAEYSQVVSDLKSLILATDMARQNEFINYFETRIIANDLSMSNRKDRHFIMQIILKCADISNPCRSWNIYNMWNRSVCKEFYRQGQYEKMLGLAVTPLFDPDISPVAKIQIGFIQHAVSPLFSQWTRWNNCVFSKQLMETLNSNLSRWKQISASNSSGCVQPLLSEFSSGKTNENPTREPIRLENIGNIDENLSQKSVSTQNTFDTSGSVTKLFQPIQVSDDENEDLDDLVSDLSRRHRSCRRHSAPVITTSPVTSLHTTRLLRLSENTDKQSSYSLIQYSSSSYSPPSHVSAQTPTPDASGRASSNTAEFTLRPQSCRADRVTRTTSGRVDLDIRAADISVPSSYRLHTTDLSSNPLTNYISRRNSAPVNFHSGPRTLKDYLLSEVEDVLPKTISRKTVVGSLRRSSMPSDNETTCLSRLHVALLLKLGESFSITHCTTPYTQRRGSLPTELIGLCCYP